MRQRFVFIAIVFIIASIALSGSAQTTTTAPSLCEVFISSSYTALERGDTKQFSAAVYGACYPPCFTWEISEQGSTGNVIDENGLYTAVGYGIDRVTVTDNCNEGISASGTVEVRDLPTTTSVPFTTTILHPDIEIDIGNGAGLPGSTGNQIRVDLNNPEDKVAYLEMDICDVDGYLTCPQLTSTCCATTNRSSHHNCMTSQLENGCLRIILFPINPYDVILEGTGTIVTLLDLDVSVSAPEGECRDINLENVLKFNEHGFPLSARLSSGEFCFAPESSASIPTLSEWGLIIFLTIVMGIGALILFRRRVA